MWKHYKFNPQSIDLTFHSDEKFDEFDLLLFSEWDRAVTDGLFSFVIDRQAQRRILDDGDLNYIIELNPSRYEKRRTPYPFVYVKTPFDRNKFHFNKIKDAEILFSLDSDEQIDRHLVVINNSPIHPYHVLLVPDRQLEQAQILTIDAILFGMKFVVSSGHSNVYAGFNSLCGYASINHLHLHGIYMPGRLFLQTIKCSTFHEPSHCYLMDRFKTEAFVFEILRLDQFDSISRFIFLVTDYLTSTNIAHNVAIVKGDALRIFIWFRQSILEGKVFERCNFACLELSGFMPLADENVFKELTEKEVCEHLDNIALPMDEQNRIKDDVKNLLNQHWTKTKNP